MDDISEVVCTPTLNRGKGMEEDADTVSVVTSFAISKGRRTRAKLKLSASTSVNELAGEEDAQCGRLGFRCCAPDCLQMLNTPICFLVCLCLYCSVQGATITGLNSVIAPTWEKRFRLDSSQSGLIQGSYNIVAGLLVIPVSYYGERAHKPLWLAIGCFTLGVGASLTALAEFVNGADSVEAISVHVLEQCGPASNHTLYDSECEANHNLAFNILMTGSIIQGMGSLPLFTLGLSFLDEIATAESLHYYIASFYVCSAAGPGLGFVIGWYFLSRYVDPNVANPPAIEDPNFIGNWWAGYFVASVISIAISIPLFMFPRQLPNTAWIIAKKGEQRSSIGVSKKLSKLNLVASSTTIDILTNDHGKKVSPFRRLQNELSTFTRLVLTVMFSPILLTNIMGATSEIFVIAGVTPFITKYMYTHFGVSYSDAALLTGLSVSVGVGGGVVFSSWLLKRRNVQGSDLAKYAAGIAFFAVFFTTAFAVQCAPTPIVGVTRPYPGDTVLGNNRCDVLYNHSCMNSCGCVSERYDPVCGADGYTYPSPCLAGCQGFYNGKTTQSADRTYTNCSCIAASLAANSSRQQVNATAAVGRCSGNCALLPLFMVMLTLLMFFTFMNNVPATEVLLQCVPSENRTLATGITWFVLRIVGSIPGPVIYGKLIDGGCKLWQLSCCKQGNCWEYDNKSMSDSMFIASAANKFLSFVFLVLSWRVFVHYEQKQKLQERVSTTATSDVTEPDHVGKGAVWDMQNAAGTSLPADEEV